MNWQTFKDPGSPIFVLYLAGTLEDGYIRLGRVRRVIHYMTFPELGLMKAVRVNQRWQPLHEASEMKMRHRNRYGGYAVVYNGSLPMRKLDATLPFIMDWEQPGPPYQIFGY